MHAEVLCEVALLKWVGGGTVHSWHNETRTDDFQQLPKSEPPHATIVVKNRSYWNGEYKESLKRNRFQSKLKHNLDNWARYYCADLNRPSFSHATTRDPDGRANPKVCGV